MHLFLRATLSLLTLYLPLKLSSYLSSTFPLSTSPAMYYTSYLPLLLLSLYLLRTSHSFLQSFLHTRSLRLFQQQNTKPRWLSALSSPDSLQYLMKNQKSIDQLVYKVKTVKEAVYNRGKFVGLMEKYVEVLKEIEGDEKRIGEREIVMRELEVGKKELEVVWLVPGGEFSYQAVEKLVDVPVEKYLQTIVELPVGLEEKRELISQHFPYLAKYIAPFIHSYLQASPNPSPNYILPLIFTPSQYNLLSQHHPALPSQSTFIHSLLTLLLTTYHNPSLSSILLTSLLSLQSRPPTPAQQSLQFYLKLLTIQIYHNYKIQLTYKNIIKINKQELFKNVMETLGTQEIRRIKEVFELQGEGVFEEYLRRYALEEGKLGVKEIMDLFDEGYLRVNERNMKEFLKLLKTKTVDECYNYQEIVELLRSLKHPYVQAFLPILSHALTLYTFSLHTPISLIQKLTLSSAKQLQESALLIFRDLIKSFSLNKMRTRYLPISPTVTLDLHSHQSILQLSLHLKQHLFQHLLTSQTMFQMIYQHLIHFGRYGILSTLLKQELLDKYNIDYSMIQIVVIEQIHNLFDSAEEAGGYKDIEGDIERLSGVLVQETPEAAGVRALIAVMKLIRANRVPSISPATIVRNMTISLLYSLASKKITIDSKELHKIYRQILIYRNPHSEPNTSTKQYRKFKAWLAKRYYQIDLKDEGLEILKELSQFKMGELCNTIIEIITAHPESTGDLLFLGYEQVVTGKQFSFFKGKFEGMREREKVKEVKDYYFKETEFVTNNVLYSNLVAECKFIDHSLKNPMFDMFFVLLGGNYKQAFYNVYKRRLPVGQIEFFLKEAVKKEICEMGKVVEWMYKVLIAKGLAAVEGLETTWKEFVEELTPEMLERDGKYSKIYGRIKDNKLIDPVELALLHSYHNMVQIRVLVPDTFLSTYLTPKQIPKFFSDKAFRKKQITQLSSRISSTHLLPLSHLASLQQINLLDLITFSLCGYLNTQKIPPTIQQSLINLTILTNKSSQIANQLLEKFTLKIFSTRILLSLVYTLMKLKERFWREYLGERWGVRVLECMAAVEESEEFYGLLPGDFLVREMRGGKVNGEKLGMKERNVLKGCLKMGNVFVLAKVMGLVHGGSVKVEREVYGILCEKSGEAREKLGKLLEE